MVASRNGSGLSRRAVLGVGAGAAAGLALAACGSQKSGGTSPSGGTSGGTPKRGGTFRVAPKTLAEATSCDPHLATAAYAITFACFSPLVAQDHTGAWNMGLAETFEPENGDPSQWLLRLKDGIEWHNGKTLDIDDVMYTIKRIADPKNPLAASNLLAPIDLNNMQKMDSRTLRLKLKTPHSLLSHNFAPDFASIVPVDFDPQHPVGTGPFKFESFTAKQRWVGTRNASYWRGNGMPYLDRLELLGFATGTAALNALMSNQVDAVDRVLPAQLAQIKQRPNLKIVESETGTIQQVSMNSRKGAPFEDPRVRQAFKLMLDREQLINSVYAGHGAVGNDVGVFPQWDDACDPSLPAVKQDLDQARKLLKEAGKENMRVKLRVGEIVTGMTAAAQVIQQQAKQIGVTIELDVVSDVSTFYTDAYYAADMEIDWTNTIDMRSGAAYYWTSDSGYNAAGYSNPQYDALVQEALSSVGEGYNTAMRKASDIIASDGPWLVWGRANELDVMSNKFTGLQKDFSGTGFNGNYWDEISAV